MDEEKNFLMDGEGDTNEETNFRISSFKERLKKREIWLNCPIDDSIVEKLNISIIQLYEEDKNKDITVYINSDGGGGWAARSAIDIMGSVSCPITTVALRAFSAGFVIFMGGDKRICFENSNLLMHCSKLWFQWEKEPDIQDQLEHQRIVKEKMAKFFSQQTGGRTTPEYWNNLFDSGKDKWFTPEEALDLNIVHKIVERKKPNIESRKPYMWEIKDGSTS